MMIFRNYNDFEIISLVKEGNEEAFNFMVEKYRYLIAKKIKNFNLIQEYDDCFQEALMILHKSIIRFDQTFDKTFTRYFENNFHNFLITYKNKKNRYIVFKTEKLPVLYDFYIKEPELAIYPEQEVFRALNTFSRFEKLVFQAKIIQQLNIKDTANFLKCSEKQVYNALDRIRKKIKLHLMT